MEWIFISLLCNQNTLEVLVAIELDDRSHNSVKTKARDKLVNFACETVGLPLLRFSAKRSYVISDIAKQISQANEIENLAGAIKYSKTS
ncbi:DUF2726 domain-containing protein [Thalassotalea sp. Y01]|uniref:DUF2726 domain-containing protein n=1 Tax=Thalassotalea sp. Y01 TaxID=2729613 RepID=UPI00145DDCA4|nr:DUF2726 domain-containing protein [Thalassotalea sp. Y01]NMP16668.1 DUF2726 domain-containing protein [Thalassotalea sp. Y01]